MARLSPLEDVRLSPHWRARLSPLEDVRLSPHWRARLSPLETGERGCAAREAIFSVHPTI
jgi:hypothetical protein